MIAQVRTLFIVRFTEYGFTRSFSGLFNSAKFVVDMLNTSGTTQVAKLVQVVDNNAIDREVTLFKPDVVVIEALWVVPEKFKVLIKLHPNVQWIIRIHSDLPFLAHEGVAIDWISRYQELPNVFVAFNSEPPFEDFTELSSHPNKVLYLPNFYPISPISPAPVARRRILRVGCFGAIRPLKNQLVQAVAAIRYADNVGTSLEFHINATRLEGGDSILRNLQSLFAGSGHTLVEHPWMKHAEFLLLMQTMHVALAVSLSETFCITAADAVASGVPLICSDQIPWASPRSIVPATDVDSIIDALGMSPRQARALEKANRKSLAAYSVISRDVWLHYRQHINLA